MYAIERMQRFAKIFSGKNSKGLWKDINRTKPRRTQEALYHLGCKCQELESIVEKLEQRIARLEAEDD
jgi:polyhydroxyalkanoate synthesis regulator phasin